MNPILVAVLTASLLGAANGDTTPPARESRHIILPFLGYQTFDREGYGIHLDADFRLDILDSTFSASADSAGQRHSRAPLFGIMYHNNISRQLFAEAALAIAHDKQDIKYAYEIEVYTFPQQQSILVSRGNTTIMTLDFGFRPPLPTSWVELGLRGGVGYAWRRIKMESIEQVTGTNLDVRVDIRDAERLFALRGGADLTLWRGGQLVATGSLFYTHFLPLTGDVDPFGGFGWRVSFFPIWRK